MEWYIYVIASLLLIICVMAYCCCNKVKNAVNSLSVSKVIKLVSKLWYFIVLIASTTYVVINFSAIKEFVFFSKFDGDNLIFVLWLFLLLLPLFDKMEIMGVGLHRSKDATEEKVTEVAAEAQSTNAISTKEELELERKIKEKEAENGK